MEESFPVYTNANMCSSWQNQAGSNVVQNLPLSLSSKTETLLDGLHTQQQLQQLLQAQIENCKMSLIPSSCVETTQQMEQPMELGSSMQMQSSSLLHQLLQSQTQTATHSCVEASPSIQQFGSMNGQFPPSVLQQWLQSQQQLQNQLQAAAVTQQQQPIPPPVQPPEQQHAQLLSFMKSTSQPIAEAHNHIPSSSRSIPTQPVSTSTINPPIAEVKKDPLGKMYLSIPITLPGNTSCGLASSTCSMVSCDNDDDDNVTHDLVDMGPSCRRRSNNSKRPDNHRVIERKYRDSITSRYNELRSALFDPQDKSTKSGVLDKAVRVIRNLEQENAKLKGENERLRHAKQERDTIKKLAKPHEAILDSSKYDAISFKETSTCQPCTPTHEQEMEDKTCENTENKDGGSLALKDRTRVTVCSFLIIFLFFSPVNFFPISETVSLVSSQPDEPHPNTGSRTLSSVDDPLHPPVMVFWVLCFIIKFVVNVLVFLGVLIHIFLLGEPVTRPQSQRAVLFRKHKGQAENYVATGNYAAAAQHYEECLRTLGRPLPERGQAVVWSLWWHALRYVFYRLGVGRRLASAACRMLFKELNGDILMEFDKINARDASQVCLALLNLSLTGRSPRGFWHSTILSMSAINFAEAAGNFIEPKIKAQIYATVAVQMMAPRRLKLLSRYFLFRSQHACTSRNASIPCQMQWLFTTQGHRFFVNSKWSCEGKHSLWSSCTNDGNSIINLYQEFKEHLLQKALKASLFPARQMTKCSKDPEDNKANIWAGAMDHFITLSKQADVQIEGVMAASEGLCCVSIDVGLERERNSQREYAAIAEAPSGGIAAWSARGSMGPGRGPSGDEVAKWWVAVGMVAINWLRGEDEAAKRYYSTVENVPNRLLNSKDPVSKALLLAFQARKKVILHPSWDKDERKCRRLCDKSSKLLRESIHLASYLNTSLASSDGENTDMACHTSTSIGLLVRLLCCDWLMETRMDMWEEDQRSRHRTTMIGSPHSTTFLHDLESFQMITQDLDAAFPRRNLYEAVSRLMMDAHPTQTLQMLQRAAVVTHSCRRTESKNKSEDCVTGEREGAIALFLACRYLPKAYLSGLGEKRKLLQDVAVSFERVGDRRYLQRCQQVLLKLLKEA